MAARVRTVKLPAQPVPRLAARLEAIRRATLTLGEHLGAAVDELGQFTALEVRRFAARGPLDYLRAPELWLSRDLEVARALARRGRELEQTADRPAAQQGLRVLDGGRT